jgi:deoxyribodipyrimidine photo-lyase
MRFDPEGDYVRRHVPELSAIDGRAVHEPWKLGPLDREQLDYPDPIVDHDEAVERFRSARAR